MTADRLIFILLERNVVYSKELPAYREEILLSDIKSATYGEVFKYIKGLKLIMKDSTIKGFVLEDVALFLEGINKILNSNECDAHF